jgi:hypothetical protein
MEFSLNYINESIIISIIIINILLVTNTIFSEIGNDNISEIYLYFVSVTYIRYVSDIKK